MFTQEKDYFLFSTATTSLVLHVNEVGKLVCEYYGSRISSLEEAPSLTSPHPFIQGTSLAYDEKHQNVSLDYLHNEFSTPGKGDFHAPSLVLSEGQEVVFDFVYDSFEVKTPEKIPGLPTPHGAKEEVVITCLEKARKAKLRLHYLVYEEEDVIGRYLEIVNENEAVLSVHKAASLQLCLLNHGDSLVSLYGAWANELNPEEAPLRHGRFLNESMSGLSSNRHNPFFLIKEKGGDAQHGACYGFNLVYSGNHQESVELDTFEVVTIQSGISPFLFKKDLAKEEHFYTPMAVMSYSKEGTNGLSLHYQDFVNDCVIPSVWKGRIRPIVYNNWEATMFSFNKAKLTSLMKEASALGIELFVLDDGWFGERNDDRHGLGDWECNTKKIPGGLASLSKEAKKLGLKFGIWMEPEMVNKASKCYQAHPDWIIHDGVHEPTEGRHQYLLDLRKKEVQDFVYASVSNVLNSADISYLKWDCNRMMSDFPEGYTSFFYDDVVGLYSVLERLVEDFPNVLFENCASGGNRFDLGMLSYFPQSWLSDDTDSFQRLTIQAGAAYGYPLSVMSNHVAAKTSNQLLRLTSLDSKFDVASFGVLGYELDLNDLTPLDKKIIQGQIAYYKEHRPLFQFGHRYQLASFKEGNDEAVEILAKDEAIVGRYEKLQKPSPEEARLTAVGLDEKSHYLYQSRPESLSMKKFGHLVNMASPIHLKEEGFLINTISARHDLASEVEKGMASGTALLSGGVALAQEWSGVGYSSEVRLVGDFGGRLYALKKR